jgi:hypothetical protein
MNQIRLATLISIGFFQGCIFNGLEEKKVSSSSAEAKSSTISSSIKNSSSSIVSISSFTSSSSDKAVSSSSNTNTSSSNAISSSSRAIEDFIVESKLTWQTSPWILQTNDTLCFDITGKWRSNPSNDFHGAEGSYATAPVDYALEGANDGALIAKISGGNATTLQNNCFVAERSGRLMFVINDLISSVSTDAGEALKDNEGFLTLTNRSR